MAANDVRIVIGAQDLFTPTMTKISALATTAFVGMGAAAIKMAMEFESSIDRVGAVSQATAGEMEGLRAKALAIGADTSKSAKEAADAMEILAANGLSAAEIMGGAADAAVALAEAGGTTLKTAADTASTAMTVWSLSASDLTAVVNQLAGAANTSKFGVEDMSGAIAQGGGVAAAAGVDFNDFATAVAATSSSFSSGSDAGTSFKTFLISLANPTEKAAKAMEDIGFAAYDASGALKPMSEIVQNLHDSLGPLTEQQRAQAAATIFGTDAMRTAMGLAKLTGDEFEAMGAKMVATDAAGIAKQRMDNLKGGVEELKGSIETLAISLGSAALPALTNAAGGAVGLVNAFGELDQGTQQLILGTAALTAALPLVINTGEKVVDVFARMATGSASTGTKVTALGLVLGGTIAAALAAKGFIEDSLGPPNSSERHAEAMERIRQAMSDMGASAVGAVAQELARLRTEWSKWEEENTGGPGLLESIFTLGAANIGDALKGDALDHFRSQIDAVAESMATGKASLMQWTEVLGAQPPMIRSALEGTQEYRDALVNWTAGNDAATASALAQSHAIGGLGPTYSALALSAKEPIGPIAEFVASLGPAEEVVKKLDKAMRDLGSRFAATNPEVITARLELAAIDEELADMAANGTKYSDLFGSSIDTLTSRKKELEGLAGAAEANAKGFAAIGQELALLVGEGGVVLLNSTMAATGKTMEQQVTTMQQIGLAFNKVASGDIPGIEKAFSALKENLTQQEWAVVGDALATKFVNGFYEQTTGEGQRRILEAAEKIGIDLPKRIGAGLSMSGIIVATEAEGVVGAAIAAARVKATTATSVGSALGDGIAEGLRWTARNISLEAVRAVEDAITAARRAAEISSPSRRAAREIGAPIAEGIAEGIAQGVTAVERAMQTIVGAGITTGRGLIGGTGGPLPNYFDPNAGPRLDPMRPWNNPQPNTPVYTGLTPGQGMPDWWGENPYGPQAPSAGPPIGTTQPSADGSTMYRWNGSTWVNLGNSATGGDGGDSMGYWGNNGQGGQPAWFTRLMQTYGGTPGGAMTQISNLNADQLSQLRGLDLGGYRDRADQATHGGYIDSLGRWVGPDRDRMTNFGWGPGNAGNGPGGMYGGYTNGGLGSIDPHTGQPMWVPGGPRGWGSGTNPDREEGRQVNVSMDGQSGRVDGATAVQFNIHIGTVIGMSMEQLAEELIPSLDRQWRRRIEI